MSENKGGIEDTVEFFDWHQQVATADINIEALNIIGRLEKQIEERKIQIGQKLKKEKILTRQESDCLQKGGDEVLMRLFSIGGTKIEGLRGLDSNQFWWNECLNRLAPDKWWSPLIDKFAAVKDTGRLEIRGQPVRAVVEKLEKWVKNLGPEETQRLVKTGGYNSPILRAVALGTKYLTPEILEDLGRTPGAISVLARQNSHIDAKVADWLWRFDISLAEGVLSKGGFGNNTSIFRSIAKRLIERGWRPPLDIKEKLWNWAVHQEASYVGYSYHQRLGGAPLVRATAREIILAPGLKGSSEDVLKVRAADDSYEIMVLVVGHPNLATEPLEEILREFRDNRYDARREQAGLNIAKVLAGGEKMKESKIVREFVIDYCGPSVFGEALKKIAYELKETTVERWLTREPGATMHWLAKAPVEDLVGIGQHVIKKALMGEDKALRVQAIKVGAKIAQAARI